MLLNGARKQHADCSRMCSQSFLAYRAYAATASLSAARRELKRDLDQIQLSIEDADGVEQEELSLLYDGLEEIACMSAKLLQASKWLDGGSQRMLPSGRVLLVRGTHASVASPRLAVLLDEVKELAPETGNRTGPPMRVLLASQANGTAPHPVAGYALTAMVQGEPPRRLASHVSRGQIGWEVFDLNLRHVVGICTARLNLSPAARQTPVERAAMDPAAQQLSMLQRKHRFAPLSLIDPVDLLHPSNVRSVAEVAPRAGSQQRGVGSRASDRRADDEGVDGGGGMGSNVGASTSSNAAQADVSLQSDQQHEGSLPASAASIHLLSSRLQSLRATLASHHYVPLVGMSALCFKEGQRRALDGRIKEIDQVIS